jgi:hypothetical protein
MNNREDLTRAEQRFLERAGEAEQQGVTLEQYYRASGLSIGWLHNIRRQLQGKGMVLPEPTEQRAVATRGKFVQVSVRPATRSEASAVCRLRHPSGWMIECMAWPPAAWLRDCLTGERDAAR